MKKILSFIFLLLMTFWGYSQQVHPNGVKINNITPGTKNDSVMLWNSTGLVRFMPRSTFIQDIGGESPLTFSLPLLRTGDNVTISQSNGTTDGFLSSLDWIRLDSTYNWGNHALVGYETQMLRRVFSTTDYTTDQSNVGQKIVMTGGTTITLDAATLTPGFQQTFLNNTGGTLVFNVASGNQSLVSIVPLENSENAYVHFLRTDAGVHKWDIVIGGQNIGGGGVTSLSGLSDVTISNPGNGQALTWDGTTWINTTLAGGVTQLDHLSDVSEVAYTNRFALMANGTGYVSRALVTADISDHVDLVLTEQQVDNYVSNNGYITSFTDDQTAAEVTYSNTTSGLTAVNVQAALDEIDDTVDALSAGASLSLDGLTDVVITSPVPGAVVKYNGTTWIDDTDRVLTSAEVNTLALANGFIKLDDQTAIEVPIGTAIPNIAATNVHAALTELQGDITTLSGGTGATDLSTTYTTTSVNVNSNTGADATINTASGTTAGVLSTTLYNNIIANNAKVTNATHTGDVTGSTVLSIANGVIVPTDLNATGTPTTSMFLKYNGTGFTWDIPVDNNTIYTHPNHTGQVTSLGDGATVLTASAITEQTDMGITPIVGTDTFIINDGGVIKETTASNLFTYTSNGLAKLASANTFTALNTFNAGVTFGPSTSVYFGTQTGIDWTAGSHWQIHSFDKIQFYADGYEFRILDTSFQLRDASDVTFFFANPSTFYTTGFNVSSSGAAVSFPNLTITGINTGNNPKMAATKEWVESKIAAAGGGTVSQVDGTGTVNGITLTGSVTSTGSLTLGGTLGSITGSQITDGTIQSVDIFDGTITSTDIQNETITEADLAITTAPVNGQVLSYNTTTGLTWANSTTGTLTGITAGTGITVTANGTTPTVASTLGTDIISTEIADGTVKAIDVDINSDGSATNGYYMTYVHNSTTPSLSNFTMGTTAAGNGLTESTVVSGSPTTSVKTINVVGGNGITSNTDNIQLGALTGNWVASATYDITAGTLRADATTASSSITTGALISDGGLGVAGAGYFGGSLFAPSFYESSLRELKLNIQPFLKSGLEIIRGLNIVEYDKIGGPKNKIGIIIDDSPVEVANEDHTAVDLYKTIFVQAKAIQELDKKVTTLEERIAKLEALINE